MLVGVEEGVNKMKLIKTILLQFFRLIWVDLPENIKIKYNTE